MADVQTQIDPAAGVDRIATLKKMSTTAGVGSQDYVSINPLAVGALLLGLVSGLVVFTNVLFILPVAGVICAIAAFRQINDSNGTQAGKLWAVLGLVLSVLIGGGVLASRAAANYATRGDQKQIAGLIESLGKNVADGSYAQAYDLFTPTFRQRVPIETFRGKWQEMSRTSPYGAFLSMKWNGRAEFGYEDAAGASPTADAIAFLNFEKAPEPARHNVVFSKQNGQWMIDDYPALFPHEKAKKTRQG